MALMVARFNLASSSIVTVLDLASADADLKGFHGGFTDGTYSYMVPDWQGYPFGKVARFDPSSFSVVTVLDITSTDSDLKQFVGGFADGTYAYTVPPNFGKWRLWWRASTLPVSVV